MRQKSTEAFTPGGIMMAAGDAPVERFEKEICANDVRLTSVKLFHPRSGAFVHPSHHY
jgi:hypothetical protein